jgi:hypothetical protein
LSVSCVLRLEYPNKNSRVLDGDQTSTGAITVEEPIEDFHITKKSILSHFYHSMIAYTYDKDGAEILSNTFERDRRPPHST